MILLTLWYFIIFIDPTNLTLPGETSIFSMFGLLLLFLLISNVGNVLKWKYIDIFSLLFLSLWSLLQWNAHWKLLIFGASAERVESYNRFFRGTYRLFPESQQYIIPDLYHSLLGALLFTSLVLVILNIIQLFIPFSGKNVGVRDNLI
jgi:hypothetical protein